MSTALLKMSAITRNYQVTPAELEENFESYRKRSYINVNFINYTDSAKLRVTKKALESELHGNQGAYQKLRPVVMTMRALGMLPIYNTSPGIFEFRMGSLPVIYSITLFTVVIMAVIFSLFTDTTTIKSAEGKFERTIDTYFVNIQLLPILLIPIMWYETPKIAISFNAWSHLERLYKRIKGNDLEIPFHHKPVVYAITLPIIGIVLTLIVHTTTIKMSLLQICIYSYINTCLAMFTGFWYLQCENLGANGISVSNEFGKVLANIGPASKISEFRALWNGLSKLTANLGSASCYTVNYIILYGFFTITLSIYEIVSEIKQGFNTKHIGILTTCLMGIAIIYILCNEAHFVIQNLRIDFQKRLLSIQLPWMSDEVYTEINMFIKVLLINPATINLGGFVIIDRNLFRSIMSTVVTYMIILLQIQITVIEE